LHHPVVDENRGSYYLGSTAPDIRFLIGTSREATHFLSLEGAEGESGVESMLEAYPELVGGAKLNNTSKAFVAGYMSHLVTDEAWIYHIYRPFFGERSSLSRDPMANLLDRMLQFELDRRERLDNKNMPAVRAELNDSSSGVDISFISPSSLKRWSEFVFISATRKANWEDFRRFAEKYLIWMSRIAHEEQETFFSSFDERLEQVLKLVPPKELSAFREKSIAGSVRMAREYLG